ncbi:MAG: hypothetical protein JJU33_09965 [Phycisphaerales bacterium]|nr:hypothetical protein [Phycisphaerales bacterium]
MHRPSLPHLAGLAAVAAAGTALSSPAQGASNDNPQIRPLVMVEWSAPPTMLQDPRDAGLVRALGMLPDRLRDLQAETPDFPPEATRVIDLAARTLSTSGRFSIFYNDANPELGMFGYGMILSFDAPDRAGAVRLDRGYRSLMEMGGPLPFEPGPQPRFEGLSEFATPIGSFGFGPRASGDRWAFTAFAGAVDDLDAPFAILPDLEEGQHIRVRGVADLRAIEPGLNTAKAFAGADPEFMHTIREIEELGLLGPDAPSFHFVYGSDAERSFSHIRSVNVRRFTELMGNPTETLGTSALRAIPADATLAFVTASNPSGFLARFENQDEVRESIEELYWEIRQATGIHLREDLFDTLGDSTALFMSDTTGSGGLMSAVMILAVDDHATLRNTINRAAATLREVIREEGEYNEVVSRLRVAPWSHDNQSYMSLRFDGLPIPLDISLALTDDWLVLGLTPQGVVGAVEHILSGDPGFDTKPFLDGRTVSAVNFVDTERFARSGYGGLSMVGSAVAAGVRNTEAGRDPGLVVPTARELLVSARPSFQIGYWEGDDYIQLSEGDPSMLVQLSAGIGVLKEFAPVIAGGVAVFSAQQRSHGGMRPRGRWSMLDADELINLIRYGSTGPDPYTVALAVLKASNEEAHREDR